ncbi:MAG TPA: hypothetical protein VMB52_00455 [Verrucomicrobiae bacterium]|nr:hypothetical protein [Verrucomicrobiae bacterium]
MHRSALTHPLRSPGKKVTKRVEQAKKKLSAWKQKTRLTVYEVRLKVFLGRRSTWVKIASHFIRRKLIYLTALYIVAALCVTWLSGHYVPPTDDATAFFTAAGAMIGAALAIILTFNTIIINFASTEYPPEFYRATGYDWRQHIIYFLLAADSIALFVFCLVFKVSPHHHLLWLFPLAVFIICTAFYLLFASYLVTRKRLDPTAGLAIIRKIAIKHLTKGAKAGDKLAKVFASNPNLKTEDKALARKEAYRIMAPLMEQVSQINNYLHDYHDKLLAKQNFATASRVLDTIYAVLAKYIEIRRDNIQARTTGYFLTFTTDTQGFFEENLQQLVDKAKRYMETRNTTGAIHVVDLMRNLAQRASTVEFGVPTENPLLDQIQGYISNITEEAIAKKDIEVMFHLADIYSVLGRQAVIKDLSLAKASIYGQLVKIGEAGALAQQTTITGRVADAFNAILIEIHNHGEVYAGGEPTYLFSEYQKVLMLYCAAINNQVSITNPQMLAPYNTVLQWMGELASLPADKVDRGTHSMFIELAETACRSMRNMSGIIPLGSHTISREMGVMVQSAANLMLDLRTEPAWHSADEKLTSQAHWYIHQLTWFMKKTNTASEHLTRELNDNASHIGLHALETNTPKIAQASVEVISYLSLYLLNKAEKGSSGYEPPRLMQNACLVGIYAKKLGMNEIYELAKVKATEFNAAFNRKYFPDGPPTIPGGGDYIGLHEDQLLRELNGLYAEPDYEFDVPMMSSSGFRTLEDKFGQYIDRKNVQAFLAGITPHPDTQPISATEPKATAQTKAKMTPTAPTSKKPKKVRQKRKKKNQ